MGGRLIAAVLALLLSSQASAQVWHLTQPGNVRIKGMLRVEQGLTLGTGTLSLPAGSIAGAALATTLLLPANSAWRVATGNGLSFSDTSQLALFGMSMDEYSVTTSARSVGLLNVVTIPSNGIGTPAEQTITPTSPSMRITCNDGNGCNITMSETGALGGQNWWACNTSTNVVNFADTPGVTELAGAFAAGQYDCIELVYVAGIASPAWMELHRSDN